MKTPSTLVKISLAFLLLSLAARSNAETVVFQDTFDAPDNGDVNADTTGRQAGGVCPSDYKKIGGLQNQSAIVSNHLERTGPGGLDATANFADRIAGRDFSLSVDIKCLSTEGWGAVSLLGDTTRRRELSPLSIRIHGNGLVAVSSGHGGEMPSPTETVFPLSKLRNILGPEFNIADFHNYKCVVAENGVVDHVSFFIDGVELPLKDDTVEFGDETGRWISFINPNNADTNIVFDNLTLAISPPP